MKLVAEGGLSKSWVTAVTKVLVRLPFTYGLKSSIQRQINTNDKLIYLLYRYLYFEDLFIIVLKMVCLGSF